MKKWAATIMGQCRSKANRRVQYKNARTGKMFSAKSPEQRNYKDAAHAQALACRPPHLLEGPVSFRGSIYYPSNRSDLDPSLLFDALEGVVYKNDRQIRHIDLTFRIDKENPRAEIVVEELEPQHDC